MNPDYVYGAEGLPVLGKIALADPAISPAIASERSKPHAESVRGLARIIRDETLRLIADLTSTDDPSSILMYVAHNRGADVGEIAGQLALDPSDVELTLLQLVDGGVLRKLTNEKTLTSTYWTVDTFDA